jgi:hypothetical protein
MPAVPCGVDRLRPEQRSARAPAESTGEREFVRRPDDPSDDDAPLAGSAQSPNLMPWASGSSLPQFTVLVWRRM